jgi:hypothetical protein
LYQIHWTADDLNETIEGWTTLAALQMDEASRPMEFSVEPAARDNRSPEWD